MIEAAGGVVWRRGARDQLEVLLVHRPRYDDWSLPKGKLTSGESSLEAAVREVAEETGFVCEVGAELPEVRYTDHHGRPKRARYWAMRVVEGAFVVNDEVDAIRWEGVKEAAVCLTYAHDAAVIDALAAAITP
jgi:8-oxo-dGTP pyrophosphatase MutT (NUDIX family)